jgi:hypothetical protein
MSMIGSFLAISDAELADLLEDPSPIGDLLHESRAESVEDIDKAWHGIHFLLTGSAAGSDSVLANVVFGTTPIGDEDVGYGPAMGTRAAVVRQIAAALDQITEDSFRSRFDAAALEKNDIYPNIWDEGEDALDYLASYFLQVKAFYSAAASRGDAVITFLN